MKMTDPLNAQLKWSGNYLLCNGRRIAAVKSRPPLSNYHSQDPWEVVWPYVVAFRYKRRSGNVFGSRESAVKAVNGFFKLT